MKTKPEVKPAGPKLWESLIGKKIIAFRGVRHSKSLTSKIKLMYVLLDDGETVIELVEQDGYTYHDCSNSARDILITKNKEWHERLLNKQGDKLGGYEEPNVNMDWPF